MSKVCAKHLQTPAFIYGYCIGCELETLRAEAQALREQNTKLQHMLADVVAKKFTDSIMGVFLSEGIRLVEEELAALHVLPIVPDCPDAGTWKPITNGRRTVVASDDFKHDVELIVTGDFADGDKHRYAEQMAKWMNARLNGKAVSEGLLREVCAVIRRQLEGCTNPSEDRDAMQVCDSIEDLLGEGKEVDDA